MAVGSRRGGVERHVKVTSDRGATITARSASIRNSSAAINNAGREGCSF